MKASVILKQKAREEDNDFRALGLHTKALREERLERFDEYIEPLKKKGHIITPFNGQKVIIETEKFGFIDYFPKANKVCVRKGNQWIKPGLKWIVEHLLKK